jgi:hypothetical protein
LDGTLQDVTKTMQERNEYFPTITVLQIFRQVITSVGFCVMLSSEIIWQI